MIFKFYTVKQGKEEYIYIKAKTKAEAIHIMETKHPNNKIRNIIIETNASSPSLRGFSNEKIKKMILIPLTLLALIGLATFFSSKIAVFLNHSEIAESIESVETTMESESKEEAIVETSQEEVMEDTPQQEIIRKVAGLIDSKKAFEAGSYVKGDIPKGEYAFIPIEENQKYYSEYDSTGNIIDNEHFDSFGYVYVHMSGNLKTDGILISIDAFKELEVSGAKEIFEKLKGIGNYQDAGFYKIGYDLPPAQYVVESYDQGYVEVATGPVGNNEIIDNEIFNGQYSIDVMSEQYLHISKGTIASVQQQVVVEDKTISKVEPSQTDSMSDVEVGDLVFRGDVAKLTSLLEGGMDPNRGCDEDGTNCVLYAAMAGNVEILELLLTYGGNPDVTKSYLSPLYAAIKGRNLQAVEILLAYDADPNLKFEDDGLEFTPLIIALDEGYNEIAEVLEKGGGTISGAGGKTVDPNEE